ncbi:hypothetical protein [Salinicoccus roseus]|uniref:hypothetical protein n=1 Tax=Salinicoccus roseus TaxID=45670 RepID=UPI0022FFDE61|nr:hypothetical protein [Salinicoccus roseus]
MKQQKHSNKRRLEMPDTYVGCTCHRRLDQLGTAIGGSAGIDFTMPVFHMV